MSVLKKEEVKHIAELARIGIKEKEIARYQKDLSSILDYFKKLKALNTQNVKPAEHITGKKNVYRQEDTVKETKEKEKEGILKNVPHKKDGKIKVKSVLN